MRLTTITHATTLALVFSGAAHAADHRHDENEKQCREDFRSKLQIIHSSDNESSFQDPNTLEEKILNYSAVTRGLQRLQLRRG